MVLGLHYLDLHLLKINMIFKTINKKEIFRGVIKSISLAKKEILATMLLKDELKNPLPASYFSLLRKRVNEGIILKRLGFGKKEDYNKIRAKHKFNSNNYKFRYLTGESQYQRLLIIDKEKLFFGVDGLFFTSQYKPLIKVFVDYFYSNFKKSKI